MNNMGNRRGTDQLLQIFELRIGLHKQALLVLPLAQCYEGTVLAACRQLLLGNLMLSVEDGLNLLAGSASPQSTEEA